MRGSGSNLEKKISRLTMIILTTTIFDMFGYDCKFNWLVVNIANWID
jgi:hypothetical protein